tara:strand:- start:300 stop:1601 length:1302 start_codon:yes stop_codon:yes gene_type:complete
MIKSKIFTAFKNSLVNLSIKVLFFRIGGVILFFGLSIFLTNFFDPVLVGKYDFTRSSLLVLGGICLLGTNQAIIYYSGILDAKNSFASLKGVYIKMVIIILSLSALFFVIINFVDPAHINNFFKKEDAYSLILKIIVCIGAFSISMLNIDTLRACKQTLFSELYRNLFRYLPFFILALTLVFIDKTQWLVEVYLLGFVILAIVTSVQVFFALKKTLKFRNEIAFSYRSILSKSSPMALSAVAYFLMQSVDIILLGKFVDFDTVAYYAVAVKIATVSSLGLQSVNIAIAPKIAEIYNRTEMKRLKEVIRNSVRLIVLLSLPALLVLGVFASFFLNLFGSEYVIAKEALWILLIGQLFNSLCGPIGIYMNMTGKQNKLHIILLLGLLLNVVLNVLLIPKYGMLGAAFATAISMLMWNAIAVIYTYKKDKILSFLS